MRLRRFAIVAAVCIAALLVQFAFGANTYEADALAFANANGWTATQAEAATYQEVVTAAGVTLGPQGQSPADFFYANVRRYVAHELAKTEKAAAKTAKKLKVKVKITGVEGFEDVTVDDIQWLDDGESATVNGQCVIIYPSEDN